MLVTSLLIVAILLMAVNLFLQWSNNAHRAGQDVETAVKQAFQASNFLERMGGFEARTQEIARAQQGLIPRFEELQRMTASLAEHTKNVETSHFELERLLRVPGTRGAFGELALEVILKDQLPPTMFGIRKRVCGGVPDAHINTDQGTICIDSKFPMDNFSNAEAVQDPRQKAAFTKQFLKDTRIHLEKVRQDYVRPENGTTPFAFVFIPSEAVYYFLVKNGFELLLKYARQGVQVTSPLTLTHKLELIRAGVQAGKLTKEAEKIQKQLLVISRSFDELDQNWRVFYTRHLKNLKNKADEVDQAYSRVREEFEKIKG